MYSDRLLKMLESKERVYKIIWLMLPLQILILSLVGWGILNFAFHAQPLKDKMLFNILTFIFCGVSLGVVILGIKVRNTIFNFNIERVDSMVDSEFASARNQDGLKSLSHTELMIFKAFHSALSRMILLCGFFEAPVISGLVLALLSGSLVYCLAGSLIGLLLWKKYIPSPAAFRREFFERVDEQLKSNKNQPKN